MDHLASHSGSQLYAVTSCHPDDAPAIQLSDHPEYGDVFVYEFWCDSET